MRLTKARRECVTAMMKDTIFEAASSLLEQHGTVGLTMDRVATKVGMATASLYSYFQDKDDLLQFFYTRLAEPCFQAMEEAASADLPAPRKLETVSRTALEHAVKHSGVIRILAGMGYDLEIRKNIRPRLLQIVMTIFEQGIREGAFRPHDPTHTSRMFLACLLELFDLQANGASDADVSSFAGTLIGLVVDGFSLHPEKCPKSV